LIYGASPFKIVTEMSRKAIDILRAVARTGRTEAFGQSTTACGFMAKRGFADDANLLKTPLYDFHVANGGGRLASYPSVCFSNVVLDDPTDLGKLPPRRQNGALRRLVDAHPVQGLHHGLHPPLPQPRLSV
jgi:hypothetical protein